MSDLKSMTKEEKSERLTYLRSKYIEDKKEIEKLEEEVSLNKTSLKEFEIIDIGNVKISLYESYLILNQSITDKKVINKDDISCFNMVENTHVISKRGGSVGISVRVAKGVYLRNSTPYNTTSSTKSYTSKIIMRDFKEIFLDTVYENRILHYNYSEKIKILNMWKNSKTVNEFYDKKAEYLIEQKKSNKTMNTLGIIVMIWFVLLILSFFSGQSSFIIIMVMAPSIAVYFSTLFGYMKNKRWIASIITIVVGVLAYIGFAA